MTAITSVIVVRANAPVAVGRVSGGVEGMRQ
jgi:hypothetical protein